MWGGYTGPGHKTIIPAESHAKITFRLVADQRPEQIGPMVRAWVEANLPEGIEAEVHVPPAASRPAPATSTPRSWPRCWVASPRRGTADPDSVLFMKEGGSGPEADLVEELGAPLVFLGAGLPTDRIHSPNERVLLPMLHRGAEAAAHLWRELATVEHAGALNDGGQGMSGTRPRDRPAGAPAPGWYPDPDGAPGIVRWWRRLRLVRRHHPGRSRRERWPVVRGPGAAGAAAAVGVGVLGPGGERHLGAGPPPAVPAPAAAHRARACSARVRPAAGRDRPGSQRLGDR